MERGQEIYGYIEISENYWVTTLSSDEYEIIWNFISED